MFGARCLESWKNSGSLWTWAGRAQGTRRNIFTASTVDLSLSLLQHFVPGCKARVQGWGRGGFFYFLFYCTPKIELENGLSISQCYETFFISHFSFHTLFHPIVAKLLSNLIEKIWTESSRTQGEVLHRRRWRTEGEWVWKDQESWNCRQHCKAITESRQGNRRRQVLEKSTYKKSLLSNSLLTLNCIYRVLGDFCVSDSTYMCTYTGKWKHFLPHSLTSRSCWEKDKEQTSVYKSKLCMRGEKRKTVLSDHLHSLW